MTLIILLHFFGGVSRRVASVFRKLHRKYESATDNWIFFCSSAHSLLFAAAATRALATVAGGEWECRGKWQT